jgi:hypothetical protein
VYTEQVLENGMLNGNITIFCCPTLSVLCEKRDGSTHLLISSVFLLLEMERKRKKESTAGGRELNNLFFLFFSFDSVALHVQRILILY